MCEIPSGERAEEIRSAVLSKYRRVSVSPEGCFSYPTGKEGALKLGYDPSWYGFLPMDVVLRFVGVGNPFQIRKPKPGDCILDAGCGCGLDTFIAASFAGASGRGVGIDFTAEMLAIPCAAAPLFSRGNALFCLSSIESLPFENASFDLVISNGVLNLVVDKPAAFSEIARVLRPEGALVAADLLVIEKIPAEVLANTDAWST